MSVEKKYSDYYEQLQEDVKKRYNDKLSSILSTQTFIKKFIS